MLVILTDKASFMNDIEKLQKQITDLQSNFIHQQETIDSLNDTVIKQWGVIDKLAKIVGDCANQLVAVSSSLEGGSTEPPPPHY
jgi:uncharacterized coiled-coil protein SlyX